VKKYALISVSDKSGAETLASGLAKLGYGILSDADVIIAFHFGLNHLGGKTQNQHTFSQ